MASNFQERELSISGSTPSIRFVWAAQIGLTIRILGVLVQCNERMYNVTEHRIQHPPLFLAKIVMGHME